MVYSNEVGSVESNCESDIAASRVTTNRQVIKRRAASVQICLHILSKLQNLGLFSRYLWERQRRTEFCNPINVVEVVFRTQRNAFISCERPGSKHNISAENTTDKNAIYNTLTLKRVAGKTSEFDNCQREFFLF